MGTGKTPRQQAKEKAKEVRRRLHVYKSLKEVARHFGKTSLEYEKARPIFERDPKAEVTIERRDAGSHWQVTSLADFMKKVRVGDEGAPLHSWIMLAGMLGDAPGLDEGRKAFARRTHAVFMRLLELGADSEETAKVIAAHVRKLMEEEAAPPPAATSFRCGCEKPCRSAEHHLCRVSQALGLHKASCEWCRSQVH